MLPSTGSSFNSTTECPYDGDDRRVTNDHAIRIALLEQNMDGIKTQLKGINTNISKLVWLVFSALVVAVLKLVLVGS